MLAVLFYLIPIFEGIAFIASLTLYLKRPVERYLLLLSIYLFIDCTVETYISYLAIHVINNLLLNSLSSTVSFCFYLYLLRVFVRNQKTKQILLICLMAIPVIFAANIFLVQKSSVFQSMTYSLGCLVVAAACVYYFWELFQSKSYVNLSRQPAFWICSGLLFYSACSFPIYGLINFIDNRRIGRYVLVVLDFVNILLYLSFSIAFLCRFKTKKSS